MFDAEDLVLIEKFDGSAFRFTLYDQRYAEHYPEQVASAADGNGSLVFGTRKTVRGNHRDSLDEIDGALHRAVRCLREGVDIAALRTLHDEYEQWDERALPVPVSSVALLPFEEQIIYDGWIGIKNIIFGGHSARISTTSTKRQTPLRRD